MEDDLTTALEFFTNEVFNSPKEITEWVHNVGRSVNYVVVRKRLKAEPNENVYKVVFMCEHDGVYKNKTIPICHTGTKKFGCPFELIALFSAKHSWWTLTVVSDAHNHVLEQYMEGHAYAMRLNETEAQLVEDLSAQHVKPRYILSTLKGRRTGNACTSKTIYNEQQKIKTTNDAERPQMQITVLEIAF
ncbi:iron-regulated transcriptional activator AFT2-like [Cynara cardunculus var. scolymus]|uniref:iron-regulated transcriptional activator AFT2-like n=1 Tax=Cynara cardunculus var. scolymus TaxID=59895 RepID=UPI000D628A14|nr:iron-regulated transcriptional activator AFT2-like [Cynara cardunculus var. scolymus]